MDAHLVVTLGTWPAVVVGADAPNYSRHLMIAVGHLIYRIETQINYVSINGG
jgi:hypothetical protein